MDEATDDELIDFMKEQFEGECQGSLEHLEDTSLEQFARDIRRKTQMRLSIETADMAQDFIGGYGEDDER
ncbi:MAG TPA: DUF6323 family protein, partial [Lachnospiraceae bacterium]|nr:DUF6323 family protein [Lachnospiraceae bacterium]